MSKVTRTHVKDCVGGRVHVGNQVDHTLLLPLCDVNLLQGNKAYK